MRIDDVVRTINDIDNNINDNEKDNDNDNDNGKGYLDWEQVGNVIQRLNINGD
jgi:hypothetical protein